MTASTITSVTSPVLDRSERQVFITRVFDAPRDLVFKAWTDPEQLARWYAPRGCAIHFSRIEALAKRTGAHPSWIEMLDRLAEDLGGRQ
jgi:hypothetical protein